MAAPRTLREPPIREALIDLRIAADPVIDSAKLSALRKTLASEYPNVDEKRGVMAELRVEAGKVLQPAMKDLGFSGLFFTNNDKAQVAQFRSDGFTLNRLRPYVGADVLILEAVRLWRLYVDLVRPSAVVRVGFRFINKLSLPYREGDAFERFLTAAPGMPADAPQNVSNFLTRMVAHETPDVAVVTQKLDAAPPGKATPTTIDIDVFSVGDLLPDEDSVQGALQRLRVLKNRVFFALLTEEAVQLYL